MNSTGRNNEKTVYLVILLLVVGLTAFSNSMKELAQIHELTVDASRLIAQWSNNIAPAEIPQIPQIPEPPQVVAKVTNCRSKQSPPSVELPWLEDEQERAAEPTPKTQRKVEKVERRIVRVGPSEDQLAKLKELRRLEIDPDHFEFRISTDQFPEPVEPAAFEIPASMFKAKNRRHGAIRINARDREMLLKTLNRSINLRIAS